MQKKSFQIDGTFKFSSKNKTKCWGEEDFVWPQSMKYRKCTKKNIIIFKRYLYNHDVCTKL